MNRASIIFQNSGKQYQLITVTSDKIICPLYGGTLSTPLSNYISCGFLFHLWFAFAQKHSFLALIKYDNFILTGRFSAS